MCRCSLRKYHHHPVWTFVDCVSYDMEKFIELGKTFGLEGAELLSFVEKRREEEREEKRRKEEEEKEERMRREEEEKEERRRRQDEEREARRQECEIRKLQAESFGDKRWKPKKLREDMS